MFKYELAAASYHFRYLFVYIIDHVTELGVDAAKTEGMNEGPVVRQYGLALFSFDAVAELLDYLFRQPHENM